MHQRIKPVIVNRSGQQQPPGRCLMSDYHLCTFQLTLQSLDPVALEAVRQRLEEDGLCVTGIRQTGHVIVAR